MTKSKVATGSEFSRRQVLKTAGAFMLSTPFILKYRAASASDPLVMVSWGGRYQELLETIVAKPFQEETNIPVKIVSGPDIAKAKGQVMSNNLEWDIIDSSGPQIMSGETQGLWEQLDTGIIDTTGLTVPATATAVPFLLYAGGIAYMPGRTPEAPRTFADFWNVKKFPGRRGLRNRAHQNLEMALLADGVAPQNMYPLNVDRAFASLEKIKPHIAQWIAQTPQTISLLQSNEIDYVFTFNGRVATAKAAGMDIEFSTQQTLLLKEYVAVLRGSKKRESAMKFISYALRPEVQAKFSTAYYSIPGRQSALPLVDPAVRADLPESDNPLTLVLDDKWWSENYSKLDRRFKEWVAT